MVECTVCKQYYCQQPVSTLLCLHLPEHAERPSQPTRGQHWLHRHNWAQHGICGSMYMEPFLQPTPPPTHLPTPHLPSTSAQHFHHFHLLTLNVLGTNESPTDIVLFMSNKIVNMHICGEDSLVQVTFTPNCPCNPTLLHKCVFHYSKSVTAA